MNEYEYKPFIEEFGETKQKGIVRRPYLEKVGWGKPIQITARLNQTQMWVKVDYDKLKEMK